MASIFAKIVNGEIPCHKIAESDQYFAFLDIRPLMRGHALCIPKKEVDYIFDLDDELLGGLIVFAKGVATAIKAAIPCNRVGVVVVGDEVPHAHVHLIPFFKVGDMMFGKPPLDLTNKELTEIASSIRKHYFSGQ